MELPTLRTTRLVLEPVRRQDTEALHAIWTDPDVRRHLWDDEIISRDRALATVEATLASAEADGVGIWTVREFERPGVVIGFCGLRFLQDRDVELLYGLLPAYWGRGLATEAASAVLHHAFAYLRLERVLAGADPGNHRSLAVMERLGMKVVPGGISAIPGAVYYEIDGPHSHRARLASFPAPE